MEDQARIYWTTIEDIEHKLSKENRTYMSKVKGYMLLSSLFHDADEVMVEHLYNMYLDVFEGQKNGLSAEEFLGDNPKAMADELLKNLPPLTVTNALNLTVRLMGVYLGFVWLSQFAAEGQIGLHIGYLFGLIFLAVGVPVLAFVILKSVIYERRKWKIWLSYSLFLVLFMAGIFGNVFISSQIEDMTTIMLPKLVSVIIAIGILLVTSFYRKEKLVRYIFLPVYLIYFAGGLLQLFVQSHGISGDFWNKWMTLGILLTGFVLFWIGTIVLLLGNRKKVKKN